LIAIEQVRRREQFGGRVDQGTSDRGHVGTIKTTTKQEPPMSDAAHAARQLDHPSVRLPIALDAAVIEFTKPRLPVVINPTGAAIPAYTVTARVLHWITALVIALMIPLGVMIGNDWGGPLRNSLYGLHETFGVLLIPIVLARLGHRLTNPPLPLPQDIPALQRFAAHMAHVGLYALLVAQPLVGWIAMSASGAPVTVLGLFALPPIAQEDRVFSEQLFVLHGLIGFSMVGLVSAHVGAALYHHVVRKDRVLMRMITG
jgi:cytochrome b561